MITKMNGDPNVDIKDALDECIESVNEYEKWIEDSLMKTEDGRDNMIGRYRLVTQVYPYNRSEWKDTCMDVFKIIRYVINKTYDLFGFNDPYDIMIETDWDSKATGKFFLRNAADVEDLEHRRGPRFEIRAINDFSYGADTFVPKSVMYVFDIYEMPPLCFKNSVYEISSFLLIIRIIAMLGLLVKDDRESIDLSLIANRFGKDFSIFEVFRDHADTHTPINRLNNN